MVRQGHRKLLGMRVERIGDRAALRSEQLFHAVEVMRQRRRKAICVGLERGRDRMPLFLEHILNALRMIRERRGQLGRMRL